MNRSAVVVVALLVVAGLPAPGAAASAAETDPTYVADDITADVTWTAEDGPYVVTTDVTVERGATLTIDPGTTVQVAEEVTITVEGSLDAAGTAADPVAFTTARPTPAPGSWEALRYAGGDDSTVRLSNTTVEHGVTGIDIASGSGSVVVADSTIRSQVRAGIAVVDADDAPSIRVTDSQFASIGRAGLLFEAAGTNPYRDSVRDVTVRGTTFSDTGASGIAIRARQIEDVTVADSSISGVRDAGVLLAVERASTQPRNRDDRRVSNVEIARTTITDAGGDGIRVDGGSLDGFTLASSEIRNVTGTGIHVARSTDVDNTRITSNVVENADTGVAVSTSRAGGAIQDYSMTVAGNELAHNDEYGLRVDSEHVIVEDLRVRENTFAANGRDGALVTTPVFDNTLVADNVARGNDGTGIELAGVRVRDVSVTGNRVVENADGGVRVSATGEMSAVRVTDTDAFDNAGFGVALEHHSTGETRTGFENNTVAGNTVGVRYAGPTGLLAANNSVVFNTQGPRDGSVETLGEAIGFVVENATSNVTLRNNDVYGHVVGLSSETDGEVSAENNYWGSESGPYHASVNPSGSGNAVETESGKAAVVPFDGTRNGPRFERPTATLTANRTTLEPGGAVQFSADASNDDDRIVAYHFVVDGEPHSARETPHFWESFDENGTHRVSVVVEDSQGVESATAASVNVTVDPDLNDSNEGGEPTTDNGTDGETTTTQQPPGADDSDEGDGPGLVGSLLTIPGLFGGVFYLVAFLVGAYGTWLSLDGRQPPVRGRVIHGFAATGVLVWLVAGVLGTGPLLTAGATGAVLWGGLTGLLYVLATR